MLRNLDRSGGVVLSEAVMMALARQIGRDRAHALVLAISREALQRGVAFRDAVAAHPEVRRHLTPREIAAALDYKNSLGLAGYFVDQVLEAHDEGDAGAKPARRSRTIAARTRLQPRLDRRAAGSPWCPGTGRSGRRRVARRVHRHHAVHRRTFASHVRVRDGSEQPRLNTFLASTNSSARTRPRGG